MITVWVSDNIEKLSQVLLEMLGSKGNINLFISKQENIIRIAKKESLKEMVSLDEKIIELGDYLCREKKVFLYKEFLAAIEKPFFEYILSATDGNQLKAAKTLGINRNTMRTKLKKLGINSRRWKI